MTTDEKYELYEKLVREWNEKMNLVADSTLPDFQTRHIKDSEQLIKFIPQNTTVIDMGSGAGFPAIVLAIQGFQVFAIESIQKKCRFLETLKKELQLPNITIVNDRVEKAVPTIIKNHKNFVLTARAFAPLLKILDWTFAKKNRYILLKGASVSDEISEAKKKYNIEYETYKSLTGTGFIVTLISHEIRKPLQTKDR